MAAPNNATTQSYNLDWNHVVTFSGAQQVGQTHQPLHIDAGSSAENPIVFTATQSDYGLKSSSTLNIAETANGYLQIDSGTYSFGYIILGNGSGLTGSLTMNGGTLNILMNNDTRNYSRIGAVANGTGVMTVKTGAVFDNSQATGKGVNMTLGQDSGSTGILNIEGGNVTIAGYLGVNYDLDSQNSALNISDGGVLTVGYMTFSGRVASTVTIDNGTIKANKDYERFIPGNSILTFTVGEGGGTIDNDGHNITIGAAIGGAGGMTFKGGGTTTLSGAVNYSGATFVTPGTILAIANSTAKTNILGTHGLVVVGVPGAGQTIVTYTSELTESDCEKVSCSLAPTTTFKIDGQSIVVNEVGPTLDNYWTGAANDGDLSNPANWSAGNVPTTGNANIYCTTNSTLTKGDTFAPTSITFIGGSAAATIAGDFSGITQIANYSASRVEFTGAVAFANNVDVVQSPGVVKFTGGATGTWLARAMDLHGTYTFTGTGERTELAGTTVKSDGVYNLPNATFYKHNADFHMEAGGRAEVKAAKINAKDSEKKLLGTFNGEFKANGEFQVSAPGGDNPTHYTCDSGNGTFIVDKIRVNQNACIVPCKKTIMGPGGIIRGAGYVRVYNSGSHEFGSYANWTMYYNNLGNTAIDKFVLYKRSSSGTWSTVTFDTTDYYDSTIGRTITCEAPIGAADAASAAKFRVTVKGKGKFVFANTSDGNIFSGGLTVNDSATVEAKANAWPGKGTVTLNGTSTLLLHTGGSNARTGKIVVNDGATLEVAESGTVTLGGDLKLNDGATLEFNFTDRKVAPVLDLEDKTVTFGDLTNITVSVNGSARPVYGSDGKFFLTSGGGFPAPDVTVHKSDDCARWVKDVGIEDGNLYASVIPTGLMIQFK